MNFEAGEVLLFDKPYRWTSFDLVKKVRYLLKLKYKYKKLKVGHAGTLDPLASGLLIVCTGKATKQITKYQDQEKEYIASVLLGKTTPSYDLETEFNADYPTDHINEQLIKDVLSGFLGETEQIPPVYSAKYIDGKRAYEYARKGADVEMRPQKINISKIELIKYNLPEIEFLVRCSKGTYIRSLVNDIGEALKSGACLINLRRTAIGAFSLNNAITIEEFKNKLALL
jgi:tRNA pseudouridine55 synthase